MKPTYDELLELLIEVRESYMGEGCDRCGTIDEDVYNKVAEVTERAETAKRSEG